MTFQSQLKFSQWATLADFFIAKIIRLYRLKIDNKNNIKRR